MGLPEDEIPEVETGTGSGPFHWLALLMGYSCCGAWSSWETREETFERQPMLGDSTYVTGEMITFTKRWQERRCTRCGRMQQKELKW